MAAPKTENVAPSKIPEVRAFLRTLESVRDLEALFPKAFEKLRELIPVHNASLKAADAVVRARGVGCGPFFLYSHVPKYNHAVLYAAVGRQPFASCGGTIEAPEVLGIDRVRFDALVSQGKIDAELADTVITWEPRYHKPGELALPKDDDK